MSDQFIPQWAERELADQAHVRAEVTLLVGFYEAWKALHAIPNDKLHRNKAERAAQTLVEISDQIETLRKPPLIVKPYNIVTDTH